MCLLTESITVSEMWKVVDKDKFLLKEIHGTSLILEHTAWMHNVVLF